VLAYVYYKDEPDRRSAAKLLSKDESWRITANIAKLPDLLPRQRAGWSAFGLFSDVTGRTGLAGSDAIDPYQPILQRNRMSDVRGTAEVLGVGYKRPD
jgi:hypothetical protein